MPNRAQGKCVVFDIGKTWVKASVVDRHGHVWAKRQIATPSLDTPLYRAFDVEGIHAWLVATLTEFAANFYIDRIMPVAHGATCAFLDEDETLLQPIQDYEAPVPVAYVRRYKHIRPGFDETLSPSLPKGLNLGCQIFWHESRDPKFFDRVRWILAYPQYWAWRLSGSLCNEVTSMGCHTDLWMPTRGQFSSLATTHDWSQRFPEMHSAWETAGTLRPEIAAASGLPAGTRVCVGLHDSNAALASVLTAGSEAVPPAVLSTGTWYIAMAPGTPLTGLEADRDCLVSVDVFGNPVPSARFMGGRIYNMITHGRTQVEVDDETLASVMADAALAMPSFVDAGGPFPGLRGEIRGLDIDTPGRRGALATLYLALVSTTCLDLVKAYDTLLIEGQAARNPTLCGLIASLRDGPVQVSGAASGVTMGAAALAFRDEGFDAPLPRRTIAPLLPREVETYRRLWTDALRAEMAA